MFYLHLKILKFYYSYLKCHSLLFCKQIPIGVRHRILRLGRGQQNQVQDVLRLGGGQCVVVTLHLERRLDGIDHVHRSAHTTLVALSVGLDAQLGRGNGFALDAQGFHAAAHQGHQAVRLQADFGFGLAQGFLRLDHAGLGGVHAVQGASLQGHAQANAHIAVGHRGARGFAVRVLGRHGGQKAGLDFFDLKLGNLDVVAGGQHIGARLQGDLGVVCQGAQAVAAVGGGQHKGAGLRQNPGDGLVGFECVLQLGAEAQLLGLGLTDLDFDVTQVGHGALPKTQLLAGGLGLLVQRVHLGGVQADAFIGQNDRIGSLEQPRGQVLAFGLQIDFGQQLLRGRLAQGHPALGVQQGLGDGEGGAASRVAGQALGVEVGFWKEHRLGLLDVALAHFKVGFGGLESGVKAQGFGKVLRQVLRPKWMHHGYRSGECHHHMFALHFLPL